MPKKGTKLSAKAIESIKNHLLAQRLTQEEFAHQLSVTPKTLSNWLSGRTTIEFKKLDSIVKKLGIGLEELFEGDIPPQYVFHQETARVAWWLYKSGLAKLFHQAYWKIAELFLERVSFVLFPKKGFFQSFEHDIKKGKNYYFQFWIVPEEPITTAKFTLSFTIANLVRIDYGEIIVKPDCVELKAYYQPPDYQVNRPETTLVIAKVATWFDELSHTFVVVSDIKFKIIEKGRVSEEELKLANDIAVFWKHFFFHPDP